MERGEEIPANEPGDDRLLVAAAKRDSRAFSPLYRRYAVPVYQYCYRRLGTREQAEDATSQIFLNALAALASHRQDRSFRSWLFSIAHNVVTDSYRSKRPSWPLSLGDQLADPGVGPEELAIGAIERDEVRACLSTIPATQRHVLELRLAGLNHKEIAEVLGKRPGAIKMLQLRAIESLRRTMAEPELPDTTKGAAMSPVSKECARAQS